MPSSPGIGMHVQVKDPDDKTILSRVYSSEGNFEKKKFTIYMFTFVFSTIILLLLNINNSAKFQVEFRLRHTHRVST